MNPIAKPALWYKGRQMYTTSSDFRPQIEGNKAMAHNLRWAITAAFGRPAGDTAHELHSLIIYRFVILLTLLSIQSGAKPSSVKNRVQ